MVEMYFTFAGTNSGPCRGFYRKQSLANAAATDNADLVAHIGALEVGEFVPADAYFDGTAIVGEDAYELVLYNALPEVDKLKIGFRALHDGLVGAVVFIEQPQIKAYYPAEDHAVLHTMIALTHRTARGVGLSTTYTNAQKFGWLLRMDAGPTDVPFSSGPYEAAKTFFEIVEAARETDSPITAPTTYFMWASVVADLNWALADCAGNADEAASGFAAASTDFSVFLDGGWIDSIV